MARLLLTLALGAALLLAGCVDPADDFPPQDPGHQVPPHFAPQEGQGNTTDPAVPGVRLDGNLTTCPAGLCVDVQAINDGNATYRISSICVDAWEERMERDGERVSHREPMFVCLAFGTSPFEPGATDAFNATWDGRLWDDESESMVDAPNGVYTWTIVFTVYEESDGDGRQDIELSFDIVIGET